MAFGQIENQWTLVGERGKREREKRERIKERKVEKERMIVRKDEGNDRDREHRM